MNENIPVRFDELYLGVDLRPHILSAGHDILAAITILIEEGHPPDRSDLVTWGGEAVTWGGDSDVRW